MSEAEVALVDWREFAQARAVLGAGFVRILGYFHEDGVKSVAAIEAAIRDDNAVALVLPAHTLKGEARQFGANRLADLAEEIETVARRCVEHHQSPHELVELIVSLRPTFEKTITLLEGEASPLMTRRPAFGRRGDQRGGFGRAG